MSMQQTTRSYLIWAFLLTERGIAEISSKFDNCRNCIFPQLHLLKPPLLKHRKHCLHIQYVEEWRRFLHLQAQLQDAKRRWEELQNFLHNVNAEREKLQASKQGDKAKTSHI